MEQELRDWLARTYPQYQIALTVDQDRVAWLSGQADCWDDVVDIGLKAGEVSEIHSVVNDITVAGLEIPRKDYQGWSAQGRARGQLDTADVVIIGAGICGCSIARQLSRLQLDIVVVEAGEDVAIGATRANNGDIHPRNKYSLGAKKFEYCLRGNALYTKWGEELGFTVKREGYLYLACTQKHLDDLIAISCQPWFARVPGAKLLGPEELARMEPLLRQPGGLEVKGEAEQRPVLGGISYPTGGSVDPYLAAIAMAENAIHNGARFYFDAPACAIDKTVDGRIQGVVTRRGVIPCRFVINCAGVYADDIAGLAGDRYFTIHGRKGTLAVLDKSTAPRFQAITTILTDRTSAMKATKKMARSKGGGMDRTVENNVLIGSSAKEVWDKEDTASDKSDMDYVMGLCDDPALGPANVIRYFTGVRAATYKEEFLIEPSLHQPDLIHVAGIQSPGLTSAPAIAEDVEQLLLEQMWLLEKARPREDPGYDPIRPRPVEFRHLSWEEKVALIAKDPAYGHIVCRCEQVTEGEIRDAIASPLRPRSIDAVKCRTRAGMGRCQGGFCGVLVAKMLAEAYGKPLGWVTKHGGNSRLLAYETKQAVPGDEPPPGQPHQGRSQE